MKIRISLMAAVAATAVAFGGFALAGDDKAKCGECPVAKKVATLLDDWKVAAEQAKAMKPEMAQKFAAKAKEMKANCPVGCRMGETMTAVRDVLAMAVAAEKNCGECPCEKPDSGLSPEMVAEAKKLGDARKNAIKNLHMLANYTAGFTSGEACSAAKSACSETAAKSACTDAATKADTCTASACPETGATAKAGDCATAQECSVENCCPIKMASKLGMLKASWKAAQAEAAKITPEARQEMMAGFKAMSEEMKAIALVPESIAALAEGFQGLNKIHAKMFEFGKKNPEFMKKIPADAKMAWMTQTALLDEAGGVLAGCMETMKSMHGGSCTECPSAKAAPTASTN